MHGIQVAILTLIDHYGYGGLLVVMALGNIGAPIGSEVVLPAAGALVASGHLSNIWLTILFAVIGEVVGGTVGYIIGRFGGRPLVERFGKYVRFHHSQLDRVDAFFDRFGTFAIFICRFVPVVRGIVSIPAGIARMPLVPFYFWYALGSAFFCGALIFAGNALGAHAHVVTGLLHSGTRFIIICAVILIVAFLLVRWIRARTANAT